MALYPTYSSIPYSNPRILSPVTKTLISQFDDQGAEQRRRIWLYNKWDVTLNYDNITKADASTLYQFFINRDGQFITFHWIDGFEDTYVKQYYATGDGSTTAFDLPADDISSYTMYGDSAPYGEGSDYTVSGTGSDGGNRINFIEAPATGIRLTTDFTGKLKVRCRFQENTMPFNHFYNLVASTGITLKGLHLDQE